MIRSFKNILHLFNALLAATYFRFPARRMTVIGITGTSGKTSTTHLLYEILEAASKKVSMISTVAAVINGKKYDTGFHVTTPSPWQLQKLIRQAADGGSKYFVLEVTSHALDQHRIFGTSVDIGVITNIAHEHLDYHGSFDLYKKAKAAILEGAEYAVLNKDDNSFAYLSKKSRKRIISFSANSPADYRLSDFKFKPRIPGKFNLYNCLAAAAVAMTLKIDRKIIEKAVADFNGIPGRMEEIKNNLGFKIIIDFAHKPNALEQVLETARTLTKKRLIVLFGCAGLRDSLKRPIMGKIAANYSDYAILTAEDPRTEDVRDIICQIAKGCKEGGMIEKRKGNKENKLTRDSKKYFWCIPDRQEAINFALRRIAGKGDTVLLCGKGHEQSMCYGTTEYLWDERRAVTKALYGAVKTVSKI